MASLARSFRPGYRPIVGAGVIVAAAVSAALVISPGAARFAMASSVLAALLLAGFARPSLGIGLALAFLGGLGLARRVASVTFGDVPYDPILLVGPVFAIVMLLSRRGRSLKELTVLGYAISGFALLQILEVANLRTGGVAANLSGLLFTAAPLAWYFVGLKYGNVTTATLTLAILVCGAFINAIYGLLQITIGFPPWDQAWIQTSGYAALQVEGQTRAFGAFASAAEYATCLGVGVVILWGAILFWGRHKIVAVAALVVVAAALFIESSRGITVLTLAGIGVLTVVGQRSRLSRATVTTLTLVCAGVAVYGLSQLNAGSASARPGLIRHQIAGLADPFNAQTSTLGIHFDAIVRGLSSGLAYPLGLGPAATNIASLKFGGAGLGSEVDISNAFIEGGLLGGALYVGIVVAVWWMIIRSLRRRPARLYLVAAVVLLVVFGQWMNGGYYALAPVVWLLVGTFESHDDRPVGQQALERRLPITGRPLG